MNSVPNNALSPKIGQVHSVHTQLTLAARMVRPGCAHCAPAARALRRVVAHNGAMLWPVPVVSQPGLVVSQAQAVL